MFQWDKSINAINIPASKIVHLFRSMREVQLALPGFPAQQAGEPLPCLHLFFFHQAIPRVTIGTSTHPLGGLIAARLTDKMGLLFSLHVTSPQNLPKHSYIFGRQYYILIDF